ncbi:MAG TPA: Mur ligase family protein, partial [Paludibacteraceae bacterium]|nr:Mur ligase family protein [Paludibacteraceae bacterium]
MKVHFIAIGGAAMHNLAIALHKKGDVVTGSDDEIEEPSRSRLAANGLLPSELGWFPEKLSDEIDTVILGKHARPDNPELLEAKKLGLKICSFPEYLFQQTRDKVRVVISGSHGKTTITAMVLFVLRRMGIKTDYLIGSQIDGFSTGLSLSDENRIAIFEGDEYLTSAIDKRPKFHVYQPHIAVISGIEWDHIDAFPTFDDYVEQFRIFSKLIERDGKLIFSEKDNNIREIADNVREDVTAIPYSIPDYDIISGVTYLNNKYGSF